MCNLGLTSLQRTPPTRPSSSAPWKIATLPVGTRLWVSRTAGLFFTAAAGVKYSGTHSASTPASLRLGHYWQLRDLYVADHHRRRGVGRALLARVRDAAAADGALRVSLTTEAGNVAALTLYRRFGFEAVDGYRSMSLKTEVSS